MGVMLLDSLSRGVRASVTRFPLPCFFALSVSGLLVVSIEADLSDPGLVGVLILLCGLGFAGSLLVDLVGEARSIGDRPRLFLQSGVVLAMIAIQYGLMPDSLRESRPPFWYAYFILLFALHLAISLVPVLARGDHSQVWHFNLSCFLRFFFSSVNAAILFGGLALALLSMDKLFELGIEETRYAQLWFVCAFLFHPLLCLGGIPEPFGSKASSGFPKTLRFSLCFIGTPIVALYLAILYAYLVKIALLRDWPDGWVAMPIFILAVVSLLVFVLSLPLAERENWARLYHRWLFRLLLPLSIVLFLALQVRLGDYGMTINRYLGLALSLWLFALALAHLVRPRLNLAWMPGSLLVVALLSIAAGPFGALGWSERSQTERIRGIADQLGILVDGELRPNPVAGDAELVNEFRSALDYTLTNFGSAPLDRELTAYFQEVGKGSVRSGQLESATIMRFLGLGGDFASQHYYSHSRDEALSTGGLPWSFDYHLNQNSRSGIRLDSYRAGKHRLELSVDAAANLLNLRVDDTLLQPIELGRWRTEVEAVINDRPQGGPPALFFEYDRGSWRFRFVLRHAQLLRDADRLQSAHVTVFFGALP